MMDLQELQSFIDNGIIEVKQPETTIFDIAGFPHYENVNSNVYAHFLNPNEAHGLGTLFLDALQSLIGTRYDFDFPEIYREYRVADQQRIDIVITDSHAETNTVTKAIIIENKLFHHLHNDLKAYYNYFSIEDKDKQSLENDR